MSKIKEIPFLNFKVFAISYGGFFGESGYFEFIEENLSEELLFLVYMAGALFVGFSKEKNEDEFIAKIRLESLMWATYIHYGLLTLSVIFIYGWGFLTIMMYNMFVLLIIFIIRFNFILFRSKNS